MVPAPVLHSAAAPSPSPSPQHSQGVLVRILFVIVVVVIIITHLIFIFIFSLQHSICVEIVVGDGHVIRQRISDRRGLLSHLAQQGCWGADSTGQQEGANEAQKQLHGERENRQENNKGKQAEKE
mmetsp:Transcript_16909/g.40582  ORF Transcript_16909/g.40582 Transcript_16909/m.40582 type:complete len:125 (-) Transcript_16909:78-452(-)